MVLGGINDFSCDEAMLIITHHVTSYAVAIQDYVHAHGHQLWQEEFSRVVTNNTEQVRMLNIVEYCFLISTG